jgi:hypothetical protein
VHIARCSIQLFGHRLVAHRGWFEGKDVPTSRAAIPPGCTLSLSSHTRAGMTYGDAKVANREIGVWRGATENGP